LRIIDCRFDLLAPSAGRRAYLEAHIPGAVYADLDHDLSAPVGMTTGRHPLPDIECIAAAFGRMGIDDATTVVVYDERSGAVAARAWWMLRWLGHSRVAVLDGGLAAWQEAGFALQAGVVAVPNREFIARAQHDWIISTDSIAAGLGRGLRLLDARASRRFEGLAEPIDAVAGHIPGAINLPFERCLEADGRFRRPGALREILASVLGGPGETNLAVMCGSGVTACHLILASKLAGLPEPRLYAGSWSEWIRDPGRPVATGPA